MRHAWTVTVHIVVLAAAEGGGECGGGMAMRASSVRCASEARRTFHIHTPTTRHTMGPLDVALDCRPGEPARASHTRHPTLRHSRSPATRPSMRTVAPRRSPPKSQPAARLALLPVTTRARRRADTKDPQGTPKARPHPRQHRAHARPRPRQPATPTTRDDRHGTTITPCKHTILLLTYGCHRAVLSQPHSKVGVEIISFKIIHTPTVLRIGWQDHT